MASQGSVKRVLITVRTYPAPAHKGAETSCTAAVTEDGHWLRLFPVPYRRLPTDKQFAKYQWIEAELKKARGDARPESHHISADSIKLGEKLGTENAWAGRKAILRPLMRPSLCAIKREQDERGHPTLGLFRPKEIRGLDISPCNPEWTQAQREMLNQQEFGFGLTMPKEELEKIPFDFHYRFVCDDPKCTGHKMSCTDWEMAQSFRDWKKDYGARWEEKFREKYQHQMIDVLDTHFYVGTVHNHPKAWIIVGLFYPPKTSQGDLF